MTDASPHAEDFAPGRPIVFRNGIVITVDKPGVILDGDVLITGDTITAVGKHLPVPEGTVEIDASAGILMPGMIDTHRHMWQTALRGYGGDWALSQYFVFYYLQHGQVFRPEDIYAGNLLSALESVDTGVTTTLDWSHALRTPDYAEAALQAFSEIPGRFVLGYGNYLGGAWDWMNTPEFDRFVAERFSNPTDMLGLQIAFDVTGAEDFPERAAFEKARDMGLRVTTHAGVWGATTDIGIDQMYDAGFMTPEITYVHAATLKPESYQKIAATGGTSRSRARASRARVRDTRRRGSSASTASRRRCRWTRASGGARTSSRRCARRFAPTARATTSRPTRRTRRSRPTGSAPRTSSGWRPWAARRRSAWRTSSARSPPARRPTCC